ncbi:MAG TPA: PEPxxWA-CTERM sorting domain-containing protein [Phenylobacterium sp.]|jgi:hypothetical protein|uniref:PEPxxWA-CTERM sorting domain-containing protein n=1 Tax=Phenylobacterium sp. TaxID=1871053 RepID=UPI002D62E345|nr:PEPxxWA-CTERM sorting domain-containing protein [Phenylobacterium sp.]HZZ68552.1 PEPxxWA-CTERM sorting domain-containing protein [Phenylobacterium sp.]
MTCLKTLLCASAFAAAMAAGAAQAGVVLSDNFDGENGGVGASPYTGFANFTVTQGAVGLVENGAQQCAGGSGACVNLDASTSSINNTIQTAAFHYTTGAVVSISFDISGNQLGCCDADDQYYSGFRFTGPTTVDDFTSDGFNSGTQSAPGDILGFETGFPTFSNETWTTHTLSFVATNSGVVRAYFGSFSSDGEGPLLDNVSVSIDGGSGIGANGGGVPEPASWALMIAGFGLAGASLRQRRASRLSAAL